MLRIIFRVEKALIYVKQCIKSSYSSTYETLSATHQLQFRTESEEWPERGIKFILLFKDLGNARYWVWQMQLGINYHLSCSYWSSRSHLPPLKCTQFHLGLYWRKSGMPLQDTLQAPIIFNRSDAKLLSKLITES